MWPQNAEAKEMLEQFVRQGMWADVDQYAADFTAGITSQPVRTPQPQAGAECIIGDTSWTRGTIALVLEAHGRQPQRVTGG